MQTIGFLQQHTNSIKTTAIVPIEYRHSICYGETGSGKTTGFIYPNIRHRMQKSQGLLVYDFKGKEHFAVKKLANDVDRLDDIIEIGKPYARKINILGMLSENDFEKFLYLQMGGEIQWWERSAIALAGSVFKIITLLNTLHTLFEKNNMNCLWSVNIPFDNKKSVYDKHGHDIRQYHYSYEVNFKNLYNIFKNLNSFILWIEGLDILSNNISKTIKDKFINNSTRSIEQKFELINTYYLLLQHSKDIEDFRGLSLKPDTDKKASGNNGVLLILQKLFKPYASKEYLNYTANDELDIVEALNSAKIVIVNTQSFSPALLNIFTESIFSKLTMRIKHSTKQPISIFIDECQRVLNPGFELPVDILREAQVDVFLSTQSQYLLIKSIGKINFLSLETNITKQYHFRNTNSEYEALQDHEYSYNNTIALSEALFFSQKELYEVEHLFQTRHNFQSLFLLNDNEIILFDEMLYEKHQCYLVRDLNRQTEREITTLTSTKKEKCQLIQRFFSDLAVKEKASNNQKRTAKRRISTDELFKNLLDDDYDEENMKSDFEAYIDGDY